MEWLINNEFTSYSLQRYKNLTLVFAKLGLVEIFDVDYYTYDDECDTCDDECPYCASAETLYLEISVGTVNKANRNTFSTEYRIW